MISLRFLVSFANRVTQWWDLQLRGPLLRLYLALDIHQLFRIEDRIHLLHPFLRCHECNHRYQGRSFPYDHCWLSIDLLHPKPEETPIFPRHPSPITRHRAPPFDGS